MIRATGLFISTLFLFAVSNGWAVHPVGPGETDADISEFTDRGAEGLFPPFNDLDANNDQQLVPEEVSDIDALRRQFKAADVDQSGALDEEEFSAFEVTEGVMPGLEMEEE